MILPFTDHYVFPLINTDGLATASTTMATYEMSLQASCLVVWVLLLSQASELTNVDSVRSNIYDVLNDVIYIFTRLNIADGSILFSELDISAIYAVLD